MIEETARIPISGPHGQRRGHARLPRRVEFGTDIAQKQDLPRLQAHIGCDAGVTGGLPLRPARRVVVAAEIPGEIPRGGVGKEELLGFRRAR